MLKVVLDPEKHEGRLINEEYLPDDLTGLTVIDVGEDFAWAGNKVDWDTLSIVPDLELAWAALRARRDTLMFATDPTQLTDKVDEYRAAWKAYRDELLTLPETTLDPLDPVWPLPPDDTELAKLAGAFTVSRTTNLTL